MITMGIQASYLIGDPQTEVTVRISSRPFQSAGEQWMPRIVAGSDPEVRTAVSAPWAEGRVSASYGSIDVANPDGKLDEWMDGTWSGQAAEVRIGDPSDSWEDWTLVAIARLNHPEYIDGRVIRLSFRTRIEDLEEAIQKHRFDGAPNEDLDGQHLPMIVGRPFQLPALVYDEVSTNEIYYYVADNFYPWNTVAWVREGLAPIYEGTDPGQFQDWPPNGFRLNSQPTLPTTVLGSGPRFQPWPFPSTRFLAWHAVQDANQEMRDLPVYWVNPENFSGSVRLVGPTDVEGQMEVLVGVTTGSNLVKITHGIPLIDGKTYKLRWKAIDDPNYDNLLRLRIRVAEEIAGSETIVEDLGATEFLTTTQAEFNVPFSLSDHYLVLEFLRDSLSGSETALFDAIWVEQMDEAALTLDQVVPYLACERGVVDGSDETGPFAYGEVDHGALVATTVATGSLELGHYWQDATTHRDLFDHLFRSCDSVWWVSPTGQLTCAPFLLTDDDSALSFDDTNRTTRIEVIPAPAERLTDSFEYHHNFKTVREGDAADTVTESNKASGARDYRSSKAAGASIRNALHPDYSHAIGAEPDKTALVGPGGGALQDRADRRLEDYENRIQHYLVEGVLTTREQAELQLMKNITLYSERLGLSAGKKVQVIDIRLRPVSGRVQITARG